MLNIALRFPHKTDVQFACVGARGLMFYLRFVCWFVYSGVQHILCCAFVLFFFLLCTLCCQYLKIVLFWLPLRYSQTFICNWTNLESKQPCLFYYNQWFQRRILYKVALLRIGLIVISKKNLVNYMLKFNFLSFRVISILINVTHIGWSEKLSDTLGIHTWKESPKNYHSKG
jgi:hypothetical protein